LGGNGNGDNNFVVTIVVASLCSLVSVAQKEERERMIDKEGQIETKKKENTFGGLQETRKKGSSSIYKEALLVVHYIVSLKGLVINSLFRFSWHNGTYELTLCLPKMAFTP
jgi:hypothetical protein